MSKLDVNDVQYSDNDKTIQKFTFLNGDSYEGEYKVDRKKSVIVKQGTGIYKTDDFNTYIAKWDNDKYSNEEIYVMYNNNTRFKGEVDAKGLMNGQGIFIFPDGSSLEARWKRNRPISDEIYRDPSGFSWPLFKYTNKELSFTTGNHFWSDMIK